MEKALRILKLSFRQPMVKI